MKVKECPIRISGIYKINFPNGKSYIGKAVDIKRRILEHNYDKKQPILYSAIQKYLSGKIEEFDILEEGKPEDLSKLEQYYIKLYKTNKKEYGYNLTSGGDGASLGVSNVASKFSEEDIKEIRHLLANSDIPIYQIAALYNCNRNTISRLDKGETYYDDNIDYPIRKIIYKPKSGFKNGNAAITEEKYYNIVQDLQQLDLSYEEICKKYQISIGTLSNLNTGKTYKHLDIIYPIRAKNAYLNKNNT